MVHAILTSVFPRIFHNYVENTWRRKLPCVPTIPCSWFRLFKILPGKNLFIFSYSWKLAESPVWSPKACRHFKTAINLRSISHCFCRLGCNVAVCKSVLNQRLLFILLSIRHNKMTQLMMIGIKLFEAKGAYHQLPVWELLDRCTRKQSFQPLRSQYIRI